MSLQDDLLTLERGFWTGGAKAYRANLDDECLIGFVGMAGVSTREQVAASVGDGPRWQDPEIDVQGFLQPTDDVALLTYEASTRRGDDETYKALVSSAYARRDGGWKMVFHQQTPLESE
jgi:hypothetical protein